MNYNKASILGSVKPAELVACDSASDFEAKFRTLLTKLDVVEGEETWGQIDTALKGLISLVQAGATKFETFVPTMKQAIKHINSAIISERTRLSGTALTLMEEMAKQMETRFTPICDMVFPSAMKTCGRANKVFVTRGVNSLTTVITYSHIPEQTPRICDAASTDPNKTVRASAAKLLMSIVSCCTVPELTPHLAIVEGAIASGVVDANPDARTTARQSYEIYIKRFGNRVEQFHAGLSATARKYLKIGATTGNAATGQTGAAAAQRLPLRDRISAQRANGKPAAATAVGPADAQQAGALSAAAPAAAGRPKPVRPMARNAPLVASKDSAGAAALSLSGEAKALESAPVATTTAASSGIESLLMSPRGTSKPALVRLFAEEPPSMDKTPHDSARPSASPTATAHESRAPSPDAKAESESVPPPASESSATAPPLATADSVEPSPVAEAPPVVDAAGTKEQPRRAAAAPPAVAKRPVSRAQRGPGLKFSSLGSGGGSGGGAGSSGPRAANKRGGASAASRGPHAVRPQSRNIVSSRMEEALRGRPKSRLGAGGGAQRPPAVKPAAALANDSADRLDRMTLRSSSRLSNSLPFPPVAAPVPAPASRPGYLRATAASAKRGNDAPVSATSATAASRGTKRRKQDAAPASTTDDLASAESAAKSAKAGARRRSATK